VQPNSRDLGSSRAKRAPMSEECSAATILGSPLASVPLNIKLRDLYGGIPSRRIGDPLPPPPRPHYRISAGSLRNLWGTVNFKIRPRSCAREADTATLRNFIASGSEEEIGKPDRFSVSQFVSFSGFGGEKCGRSAASR